VVIDGSEKFEGDGPDPKSAQNEAARKALSFIISFGNRLSIFPGLNPLGGSSSWTMETPVSDLNRLKPGTRINIIKAEGFHPKDMKFTARGFSYTTIHLFEIY